MIVIVKCRELTNKELKERCKVQGIVGYSRKRHVELVALCCPVPDVGCAEKNRKELKTLCKQFGIHGYSHETKPWLIDHCCLPFFDGSTPTKPKKIIGVSRRRRRSAASYRKQREAEEKGKTTGCDELMADNNPEFLIGSGKINPTIDEIAAVACYLMIGKQSQRGISGGSPEIYELRESDYWEQARKMIQQTASSMIEAEIARAEEYKEDVFNENRMLKEMIEASERDLIQCRQKLAVYQHP